MVLVRVLRGSRDRKAHPKVKKADHTRVETAHAHRAVARVSCGISLDMCFAGLQSWGGWNLSPEHSVRLVKAMAQCCHGSVLGA